MLLNRYIFIGIIIIFLLGLESCSSPSNGQNDIDSNTLETSKTASSTNTVIDSDTNFAETDSLSTKLKNDSEFPIPIGFKLFQKIRSDLNEDGIEDCVLIIKGTNPEKVIEDEYRGQLDRNRRGILIYLSNHNKFDLTTRNLDCFSSENEDGGVYFPPELSIEINDGKLFISYEHGRYGNWRYTFRHNGSNFDLIGFDISNNYGPIINSETSINFLTKRKLIRENINPNTEESGDEIFKETWVDIEVIKFIQLSSISDFDTFEF